MCIPAHKGLSAKCEKEINRQWEILTRDHESLGEVEVTWSMEDPFLSGGPSIGRHRQKCLDWSTGKYVCFLDADDFPSPNYLETLVRMCNEDKDVVTFRDFTTTDFYWTVIDMSLKHTEDEQATPDRIVKRKPWLVCPVRSEYAKQFQFPDINYGEDAVWMEQVLTLCKTEVHTDQILRSYRHSSKTSEADRITKHQTNAI